MIRRAPFITGIASISRVVADLGRAEAFYCEGLGFHPVPDAPRRPDLPAPLGLPGTTVTQRVLRLGAEDVALVRFGPPGPAYPAGSRSNDLWFQHLAVVVDDMAAAFRQLSALHPAAISTNGPERLPPRNGGVSAFKFRDPDGHPLELIHFPPGQGRAVWQAARHGGQAGPFLGIDHSALSVSGTARSLRFYRRLGFRPASRSWNRGPAQAGLDGLPGARLRVTGLRLLESSGLGLELLAYHPPGRPMPAGRADAAWVDWVTLLYPGLPSPRLVRDPDGHRLLLTGADYGAGAPASGPVT
jgi:catechol 2,3-dioxygenase-like lactoylglutathione lyase family enzyme